MHFLSSVHDRKWGGSACWSMCTVTLKKKKRFKKVDLPSVRLSAVLPVPVHVYVHGRCDWFHAKDYVSRLNHKASRVQPQHLLAPQFFLYSCRLCCCDELFSSRSLNISFFFPFFVSLLGNVLWEGQGEICGQWPFLQHLSAVCRMNWLI